MNKMLEFLNRRNPDPLQKASDYAAQNGGDPKAAFYNLCKEKGINMPEVSSPEEAFKILLSQGFNFNDVIKSLQK